MALKVGFANQANRDIELAMLSLRYWEVYEISELFPKYGLMETGNLRLWHLNVTFTNYLK